MALVVLLPGCGNEAPSAELLQAALHDELPENTRIVEFRVDAREQRGDDVDPLVAVRFTATVEPVADLYRKRVAASTVHSGLSQDEKDRNAMIRDAGSAVDFVKLRATSDERVSLPGKILSKLEGDVWAHDVEIDADPFRSGWRPLDAFKAEKVIVLGSDEEQAYLEQWRQKRDEQVRLEQERQAEEQRQRAELLERLASFPKTIVGAWVCDCGDRMVYKNDGTVQVTNARGSKTGRWELKGEILHDSGHQYKITALSDDSFSAVLWFGTHRGARCGVEPWTAERVE